MDCCNYPEYRAAPYYYYPGQYPPYWGGGGGGGGGHYGGGGGGYQEYGPPPSAYPAHHHVQAPRDVDYHSQTHHIPTDYAYAGKERLRRMRDRPGDNHRGALEWAEGSDLPPVSDNTRDTPWSYYQNSHNGWQSSGSRSGYPVRPVALQGGFPPAPQQPPPPPPPPLAYPNHPGHSGHPALHRDPLRGMAAMQAAPINTEKMTSSCSWEQYHHEAEERVTPRPRPPPSSVSPAPRQHRQPRAKDELKASTMERTRKNKSPKSVAREEPPLEPLPPLKTAPDAVPLPAFQQAFGSTEIGRFSEAFTSAGAITEDMVSTAISQGLLGEWREAGWGEGKEIGWGEGGDEPPWSARGKEIKCEDTN